MLTLLACAPIIGGCTIVRVTGANPETQLHFGLLQLTPSDPEAMVAVEATGFGLVPGVNGATLGFAHSQMVFMTDVSRCRLVIFEAGNDPQSRAFWAKALQDVQQSCIKGEKDDGG